jgi:hypothetical protein
MTMSPSPKRVALGVGVFAASLGVGFVLLRATVRAAFPEHPHTEAHEGAGDAMLAGSFFLLGLGVWAIISLAVALRIAFGGSWAAQPTSHPPT